MNILDISIEDNRTKSTLKQFGVFLILTLTTPPKYDELGKASFPLSKHFLYRLNEFYNKI